MASIAIAPEPISSGPHRARPIGPSSGQRHQAEHGLDPERTSLGSGRIERIVRLVVAVQPPARDLRSPLR